MDQRAFLASPERLRDPYPFYRMLRENDPVLFVSGLFGLGAWVVTSHAVCESVLRSKQFGKEGQRVLTPEQMAHIPQENAELAERRRANMLFRDPPAHTRLRGLVNAAFTPRTVERLRPRIAEVASHLVDRAVEKKPFDLIRDFAFPLPIIVIAELLGVPAEDRDRFKAWSTDLTLGLNPGATPDELRAVKRAVEAIDGYMAGVIDERRREARADLISDLVRVQEQGDKLSMEELLATCRLLLTAGHETTVNLIGNGALALLRNPDERAKLADRALLPNAVEELLRFDSPVQMTMRFAFEAAPLGRHQVKPGDLVVLLLAGANRDPERFAEPERLDVRRPDARGHVSFGAGIHYCIGAPLARLEGEIAFDALLSRLPGLSIATPELTWRPNVVLRGLQSLPVNF